jgi:predicted negative regulator of RcsB-dependent stress response
MDAQRRHELKTNELSEALERIVSWNDPTLKYWLGGILLVLLIYGGYRLWGWNRLQTRIAGWERLIHLDTSEADPAADPVAELRSLADSSADRSLSGAARLRLAQALIERAERSPAEREALLQQAAGELQSMIGDPGLPSSLVAAATYALASVHESLRDFPRAEAAYRTLAEPRFAGTPFQFLAEERLKTLPDLARPVTFAEGKAPPPPLLPPAPGPEARGTDGVDPSPTSEPAAPQELAPPADPSDSASVAPQP